MEHGERLPTSPSSAWTPARPPPRQMSLGWAASDAAVRDAGWGGPGEALDPERPMVPRSQNKSEKKKGANEQRGVGSLSNAF